MDKKQIRTILLFQFKLGRKATETARDVNKAFGPGTISEATVRKWFKKFSSGDESLQEKEHTGEASSTTIRQLANEIGVTYATVARHVRQIGKPKYVWVKTPAIGHKRYSNVSW